MRPMTLALAVAFALFTGIARAETSPHAALRLKLPEVRFDSTPLVEAIAFLRDVSDTNVHVNWAVLEAAGIDRHSPVTVNVAGVTLGKVLSLILANAAGPDQLTFFVDRNVLEITTAAAADQRLVTRVYPVDDLLLEIPDFVGPSFDLSAQTSNSANGNGKGGGGNSGNSGLFSNQNAQSGGGADANRATEMERAQALIDLITQTIRPEIWKVNGGTAAIRYFRGFLIITAPPSVHEAIGG